MYYPIGNYPKPAPLTFKKCVIRFFKRLACNHVWVDTDIPFVDYMGGWYTCKKCRKEKYIRYWNGEYALLKRLGKTSETMD